MLQSMLHKLGGWTGATLIVIAAGFLLKALSPFVGRLLSAIGEGASYILG